jgi:hypothetical protein
MGLSMEFLPSFSDPPLHSQPNYWLEKICLTCANPPLEVFGWKANLCCVVSAEVGVDEGDATQQTKAHWGCQPFINTALKGGWGRGIVVD